MGSGYAYRCEVCDIRPAWSILRRGDVATSWACACHLHEVCLAMQRDHEITELVIKDFAKSVEWAEIGEMLRKVDR